MSKTTKHTADANWHVQELPDLYVVDGDDCMVCLVGGYANRVRYTDEDHRRARLIAAAPDLLEACQSVAAQYSSLYESMDSDYAAFFTAMEKVVGLAREAVEKATGAAPPIGKKEADHIALFRGGRGSTPKED